MMLALHFWVWVLCGKLEVCQNLRPSSQQHKAWPENSPERAAA